MYSSVQERSLLAIPRLNLGNMFCGVDPKQPRIHQHELKSFSLGEGVLSFDTSELRVFLKSLQNLILQNSK